MACCGRGHGREAHEKVAQPSPAGEWAAVAWLQISRCHSAVACFELSPARAMLVASRLPRAASRPQLAALVPRRAPLRRVPFVAASSVSCLAACILPTP